MMKKYKYSLQISASTLVAIFLTSNGWSSAHSLSRDFTPAKAQQWVANATSATSELELPVSTLSPVRTTQSIASEARRYKETNKKLEQNIKVYIARIDELEKKIQAQPDTSNLQHIQALEELIKQQRTELEKRTAEYQAVKKALESKEHEIYQLRETLKPNPEVLNQLKLKEFENTELKAELMAQAAQIAKLKRDVSSYLQELATLKKTKTDLQAEFENYKESVRKQANKNEKTGQPATAQQQSVHHSLKQEEISEDLNRKDTVFTETLIKEKAGLTLELERLKKELADLNTSYKTLQIQKNKSSATSSILRAENTQLRLDQQALKDEIQRLLKREAEQSELLAQNTLNKASLEQQLKEELNKARLDQEKLESEIALCKKQTEDLRSTLKATLEELSNQGAQKQKDLSSWQEDKEALSLKIQNKERELERLNQSLVDLQAMNTFLTGQNAQQERDFIAEKMMLTTQLQDVQDRLVECENQLRTHNSTYSTNVQETFISNTTVMLNLPALTDQEFLDSYLANEEGSDSEVTAELQRKRVKLRKQKVANKELALTINELESKLLFNESEKQTLEENLKSVIRQNLRFQKEIADYERMLTVKTMPLYRATGLKLLLVMYHPDALQSFTLTSLNEEHMNESGLNASITHSKASHAVNTKPINQELLEEKWCRQINEAYRYLKRLLKLSDNND